MPAISTTGPFTSAVFSVADSTSAAAPAMELMLTMTPGLLFLTISVAASLRAAGGDGNGDSDHDVGGDGGDGGVIELDVSFTQAEIATLVGSTRQSVNASLSELDPAVTGQSVQ